ncbi:NAD(P)H-hydrate dehydratase [uncultured Sphingomonas sp.]|uniref:NAD(P)H-hydrate dehydratase n=1 Tax=uncultured Sphingomonas sp. TaxID=158754 RepID=UPI0035CB00A6
MIAIAGQPILTAAAMRAAEDRAIAAGSSVGDLMERAGAGIAEAVRRLASGGEMLVLCGPGNNGGDGYVAARLLRDAGLPVRVAASGAPASEAAVAARAAWGGAVETLDETAAAPVLVDALFGTGLSRPLDRRLATALARLAGAARLTIAVDLPSGIDTDTGADLGAAPADLTLALGAVKPAHLLQPGARHCGAIRLLDIGIAAPGDRSVISRPALGPPAIDTQKYSRGMVAVVGGQMAGASMLAAEAAMRAGAGYALLLADAAPAQGPLALVQRRWSAGALDDERIGAVVIGPGLGRDAGRDRLDAAIAGDHALVIDGDALHLLDDAAFARFARRERPVVLTPHGGEFAALFGARSGSKIDAAGAAAKRAGATIVFKGPDTVIAHPDGRAIVAGGASSWLSTAGTGDVLAGAIGAMLAAGVSDAAAAAVWLHAEAARRLGGAFIADDLARALGAVRAAL